MTPTLSLCVIAGNVENHIGRFIDAFYPLADEIIIVRACGNTRPDGTLEIARSRNCVTGEYTNKIDWPHVDDFSAARNMACDMATGDWLMWADTDDLITPESIKFIRELLTAIGNGNVNGILMPYVVPEDGVVNWRERIWRKGSARWVNPIHECLEFEDERAIRFDKSEIVHASGKRTRDRDERNLRIIESIPESKRTISQRFHLFQSMIALDMNDAAIEKAMEFAQLPDVGRNELYEAFFQLARLADGPETKKAMLLQAVATDPTRREAFGEIGLACLSDEPDKALGWTSAMMSLDIPENAPWNLRRAYYGQLGVSLRAMALRGNSRFQEADEMEREHFKKHGSKISLIHATRGRFAKAWRARRDWLKAADNPDSVEHIYGIDADDPESTMLCVCNHVTVPPNLGPVAAWNAAAVKSSGAVLVQLSDDWEPFQGWDTAILDAIGDTSKPAVLAVGDGTRTDNLLCMAIMTRARYKDQGFMFHPEFFSMFSDDWFSHCAFRDGVVIDERDRIIFEHQHPAFGKAEMDKTYARSNAGTNYEKGLDTFKKLKSLYQ